VANLNPDTDGFGFKKQDQVLFLFIWKKLWSVTNLQSQPLRFLGYQNF